MSISFAEKDQKLQEKSRTIGVVVISSSFVVHLGKVSFTDYWGGKFSDDIGWRVFFAEENRLVVISEDIIDVRRFNAENAEVTWATSDLRTWLNGEFRAGWSQTLKNRAMLQNVPAPDSSGGKGTTDMVYLMDVSVAEYYLPSDTDRQAGINLTPEAIQGFNDAANTDIEANVETYGGTTWWLRSPGDAGNKEAFVSHSGTIKAEGDSVNLLSGIRPVVVVWR